MCRPCFAGCAERLGNHLLACQRVRLSRCVTLASHWCALQRAVTSNRYAESLEPPEAAERSVDYSTRGALGEFLRSSLVLHEVGAQIASRLLDFCLAALPEAGVRIAEPLNFFSLDGSVGNSTGATSGVFLLNPRRHPEGQRALMNLVCGFSIRGPDAT